ncbi:MAG TPA: hypothetical protein VGC76_11290 [Pyrinomonadaceae bacterium]|jgi:hypothetical protein
MKISSPKILFSANTKTYLLTLAILVFVVLACKFNKNSNGSNNAVANTNPANESPRKVTTPEKESYKKANAAKGEIPDEREMQEMTRRALLDFDDAVKQGDFTDFHKKISIVWQSQTTPEKFNQAFSDFIKKKVDISEIANIDAKFSPAPSIDENTGLKKLIATGSYEIKPKPVKFSLKWIAEGNQWKLFGIDVDTTGE